MFTPLLVHFSDTFGHLYLIYNILFSVKAQRPGIIASVYRLYARPRSPIQALDAITYF